MQRAGRWVPLTSRCLRIQQRERPRPAAGGRLHPVRGFAPGAGAEPAGSGAGLHPVWGSAPGAGAEPVELGRRATAAGANPRTGCIVAAPEASPAPVPGANPCNGCTAALRAPQGAPRPRMSGGRAPAHSPGPGPVPAETRRSSEPAGVAGQALAAARLPAPDHAGGDRCRAAAGPDRQPRRPGAAVAELGSAGSLWRRCSSRSAPMRSTSPLPGQAPTLHPPGPTAQPPRCSTAPPLHRTRRCTGPAAAPDPPLHRTRR